MLTSLSATSTYAPPPSLQSSQVVKTATAALAQAVHTAQVYKAITDARTTPTHDADHDGNAAGDAAESNSTLSPVQGMTLKGVQAAYESN